MHSFTGITTTCPDSRSLLLTLTFNRHIFLSKASGGGSESGTLK